MELLNYQQKKKANTSITLTKNTLVSFFIPASGSGSRMFQFIFDFLSNNKNQKNESLIKQA